jgi:hypothetical protein
VSIDDVPEEQQLIQNDQSIQQQDVVVDAVVPDKDVEGAREEEPLLMQAMVSTVVPPHPNVVYSNQSNTDNLIDDGVLLKSAIVYLHWHSIHTTKCLHLCGKKGKTNQCNCLSAFAPAAGAANGVAPTPLTMATAWFLTFFSKQSQTTQQQYVMFWYRSAFLQWKFLQAHSIRTGGSMPYHYSILLFNNLENNLQVLPEDSPFICSSAIQIVSGKKGSFWHTCIRAVQNNTFPEHGLVGKSSNNSKVEPETLDSLCTFFGEVESLCEVIPTRFVRDRSGTNTTRDNDNEVRTLPPYWSKRKLYARWCSEHGWNVVTTQVGVTTHNK